MHTNVPPGGSDVHARSTMHDATQYDLTHHATIVERQPIDRNGIANDQSWRAKEPLNTVSTASLPFPDIHDEALSQTLPIHSDREWAHRFRTRNAQDDVLASDILRYSASMLPAELKNNRILDGYIGNPVDLCAYRKDDGSTGLRKLEDDIGGWGGILHAPTSHLSLISRSLADIGRKLSFRASPVILIGSSDDDPYEYDRRALCRRLA